MYWIAQDFFKESILVFFSMIPAAIICIKLFSFIFRRDWLEVCNSNKVVGYITTIIIVVVGAFIALAIDSVYASLHPHHLHIADRIEYYDPYSSEWHYYPDDDTYCTAEGDRITKEEALRQFNDTHDFELDPEGNVIATYPKGEGPAPTRDESSPYYVFNMSDEQAKAYEDAKAIVSGVGQISKSKLYDKLTDPNDYRYNYPPEIASFAVQALEENGIADWTSFCKQVAFNITGVRPDLSREDVYRYLTEDKGYTSEEAWAAIDYAF